MKDNHQLMMMISTFKMDLRDVQSEFEYSLSKSVKSLTSRTQSLDNLFSEIKKDKKCLGFQENVYVLEGHQHYLLEYLIARMRVQNTLRHCYVKSNHHRVCPSSPSRWTCHLCGKVGNIRPICYKLHGYSCFSRRRLNNKSSRKTLINQPRLSAKIEQRVKNEIKHNLRNVAFISIYTYISSDDWYFDSRCCRHMTGNFLFLTEFKECNVGHVTFGDGVKGKVIQGKET